MKIIDYNGQQVYTPSNHDTTAEYLDKSQTSIATIVDAYFFKLDGDRNILRTGYDRETIDKLNSGLMVQIKKKNGEQAGLSIGTSENIERFLNETQTEAAKPETLIGKKVTEYTYGSMMVVGIGIEVSQKQS